jgi:hypothetical protein
MIVSTLGFAFFSNPNTNQNGNEKIKYNSYEFQRNSQGLWQFVISGQTFTTEYNPQDTENISINFQNSLSNINGKPLYYVISNGNAVYEIENNLGRYASRSQEVCLAGEKCEQNLVIKSCSDNIFAFKETNYTKIYKQGNCTIVEAPYSEQVKISDRLIFNALGIQ